MNRGDMKNLVYKNNSITYIIDIGKIHDGAFFPKLKNIYISSIWCKDVRSGGVATLLCPEVTNIGRLAYLSANYAAAES
jgi:hypothetical protein